MRNAENDQRFMCAAGAEKKPTVVTTNKRSRMRRNHDMDSRRCRHALSNSGLAATSTKSYAFNVAAVGICSTAPTCADVHGGIECPARATPPLELTGDVAHRSLGDAAVAGFVTVRTALAKARRFDGGVSSAKRDRTDTDKRWRSGATLPTSDSCVSADAIECVARRC